MGRRGRQPRPPDGHVQGGVGAQVAEVGRLPEEGPRPAQHQEVDRDQAQQQHVNV